MRANIFPIFNNSLLIYNEAKNNTKESELVQLLTNPNYGLIPAKAIQCPEIVFMTSYPPRECGIATYTQDLKNAMQDKFGASISLKICALEKTFKIPLVWLCSHKVIRACVRSPDHSSTRSFAPRCCYLHKAHRNDKNELTSCSS